jgi:HEAT repeat protein
LVDLIRQDESSLCLAALKEIGIKAVPELLPALKDRDPNVRKYIALALGDMQASPAATHLAENLLTDQAEQARVGAVVALRNLGPLAAPVIPALIKALTDVSPEIRYRAAHALWRIGTPARCAEAALRVAFSQDPDVRGRVHAGMALVAVGVGDAQLLGEIQQVVAAEKGRVFKNAADWVQAEAAAIEQELLRKVENNRQ